MGVCINALLNEDNLFYEIMLLISQVIIDINIIIWYLMSVWKINESFLLDYIL